MINVSNDFKIRTKKIKQQNIKLTVVEEATVQEVRLLPDVIYYNIPISMLKESNQVIAKELKYSFEGNLFKTIMKQIEITVKNAAKLKDKNINFKYGLYINNKYEYIDLGDYYIKDVEDDKGKSELVVTGYDKMINFMKDFKQSELNLTYPCSMLLLIQKMCEVCGVELYSTNFFNSNLMVAEDYFTEQKLTYRDVLEKVAESTETTIFIKDNKLYLHKLADVPVEKLDSSYLTGLTIKEKFGPINALVLGRGDVEDNIEAKDDTSISQNGRCEIRFDENEFVEYQREQVIDEMFEQIKGIEYYVFEASDLGVMWLEPCDLIEVEDIEESTYKTIYLSANIKINTGISSDIETNIPSETNTEYKVTSKEEKKALKVERLAKKNEGLIQDIIVEQTGFSNKLVEIKQTVDGISQTVESMEDFTREKTQSENLHLENVAEGEGYIIKFIVYGNTRLFNSNEITICASSNPRGYGEAIYLLTEDGQELLAEDGQQIAIGEGTYFLDSQKITLDDILRNLIKDGVEYFDTLEISQDGTISVVRKIGIDEYGELYVLPQEQITMLEEKIVLPSVKEGVYYFIQELSGIKYYSNYITENDYSDTFLTKLELGTKIIQNAESIRVAWNQISQYLQMEGIGGKATLNIYNENDKILMSLSQDGQTFYDEYGNILGTIGIVREKEKDTLAFSMPVDWDNVDTSRSMAWGIVDPNGQFLPVFYLSGYYGDKSSEYGGELVVEGKLSVEEIEIIKALNLQLGIFWSNNKYIESITSEEKEWLLYKAPFGHEFYCGDTSVISMNNNEIYVKKPFFIGNHRGYPMIGINESNKYNCWWDGENLWFYVDGTLVSNISDKRLKSDFKKIEDRFLEAIKELEIQQFKCKNRNGQITFGIIAQDLIEVFNKYKINPSDYEIIQEMQYDLEDSTKYYRIDYNQFLILKQLATDKKLEQQQNEIYELKEIIKQQQEQINKLLEGTN